MMDGFDEFLVLLILKNNKSRIFLQISIFATTYVDWIEYTFQLGYLV